MDKRKKFQNKLKKMSIEKLEKESKKRTEEYNKELLGKSKPYEELIIPVSGIVKEVKGYNYATSHTPISEMIIGGKFPVYKTGYQNKLEIIIESDSQVEKLSFNGACPIEKGDSIRAYIFAGEKKELKKSFSLYHPDSYPNKEKEVLIPREPSEEETAIYIEKIKNGKVVRTEYSVNYIPSLNNL